MAAPLDFLGQPRAVACPGPMGSWGGGRCGEERASPWLKRTSRRLLHFTVVLVLCSKNILRSSEKGASMAGRERELGKIRKQWKEGPRAICMALFSVSENVRGSPISGNNRK